MSKRKPKGVLERLLGKSPLIAMLGRSPLAACQKAGRSKPRKPTRKRKRKGAASK